MLGFFIILLSLFWTKTLAQEQQILLTDSVKSLDEKGWRFHAGDNLQFANPQFNDNSWEVLKNSAFGEDKYAQAKLPLGWNGFGWFRIWIRKRNIEQTNTFGIYLNNDAASEVYLDGKKVGGIGKVGHSKNEMIAKRQPFLCIPIAITDTQPHLLAVRFSNFYHYYPNFVGFNMHIGDLQEINSRQKAFQRFYDYLLMSASAAGILILLHLLLFLFYPQKKINLYYVLFVSVVAMGLFARYQTIVNTDPTGQILYTKIFLSFVTSHLSFAVLLLYSTTYHRLPRLKVSMIGIVTVAMLCWVWTDWYDAWHNQAKVRFSNIYQALFAVIFITDAMFPVVREIRKGNKKLWLIVTGIISVFLLGVFIGSNQFGWFTFRQVMFCFAWGNLLLPFLFSIYIALDVAQTNRSLSKQLIKNKKLAEENVLKEQEKLHLISEQAQKLEKTVLERTAEVRNQAAKLEEMDRAKSSFFVNITHEFKTPLTLIINPAKELLENSAHPEIRTQANFILQNGKRLQNLINQLLDIGKIESRQMQVYLTDVDLIKWLNAHVSQFESLARSRKISVSFQTDVTSFWVRIDVDKMEKIVQNLISNAIKFSKENGTVSVRVGQVDTQHFVISVADNGIGISSGKLPHIFDRFYQVDTSDTRSHEGIGIGLALVKELVDLLGGTMQVKSEPDKGTAFLLNFPLITAAAVDTLEEFDLDWDESELEDPNGMKSEISNSENPLILLVEDNESLREFIAISLKNEYQVIAATDGEDGVGKAVAYVPDLVLTDLMMPKKNGYEVCRFLKDDERTSHIPVIMLTAKSDLESKIHGINTGADAYLQKPFDKRELLATIENLINKRKQLREKFGKYNRWFQYINELPSMDQAFMDKLKTVLEARMEDSTFGAEQLAQELALSRTQLYRKLKSTINKSPGEFIRSVRMEKAMQLLSKQIVTVSEACYLVGYANPSNFSTSFSSYFGFPPSEVKPSPL